METKRASKLKSLGLILLSSRYFSGMFIQSRFHSFLKPFSLVSLSNSTFKQVSYFYRIKTSILRCQLMYYIIELRRVISSNGVF